MRRKFVVFALAFSAVFPVCAETSFTGTWKADGVGFAPWTFVFKPDGAAVTGAVSQGRFDPTLGMSTGLVAPVPFEDGKIDGNRVSFTLTQQGNTIKFNGILNGEQIDFSREVTGTSGYTGIFGAKAVSHFTAKLDSRSTDMPAPAAAGAFPARPVGTRVVFIGTGTPVVDPERSGPAVAIVAGGTPYLVDAGPGVVRRASAASRATGLPLLPIGLTTVFLTHLHSDHTLGLPDLILTPAVTGRGKPIDIYGPKGTKDMTDNILAAWKKDIDIRVNGLEQGNPNAYKVNAHEIAAGEVYKDANVTVKAIAVKHGSWDESFGYRFEGGNRVIVISGDTSPAHSLIEACNGCDVLVHEVYCGVTASPGSYNAAFHTSAAELAEIAKQAHPKLLVLFHQLYGGGCSDPALLEQVQAGYSGAVVSAKDFDVF